MKLLSTVGVIVGIVAGIVTVWGYLNDPLAPNPVGNRLVGTWSSKYSYPTSMGRNEVDSISTLFRNGKYNVTGEQTFVIGNDGTDLKATYELSGAGTWSSESDNLYMTLGSLKTSLTSVTTDRETIPAQKIPRRIRENFTKPENYLADGTTQQYRIMSINGDEVLLRTANSAGKAFEISMRRQGMNP